MPCGGCNRVEPHPMAGPGPSAIGGGPDATVCVPPGQDRMLNAYTQTQDAIRFAGINANCEVRLETEQTPGKWRVASGVQQRKRGGLVLHADRLRVRQTGAKC
jgi:hypothetical protein